MNKSASKSKGKKPRLQLDHILASLPEKLTITSCRDVLDCLSPIGVVECLLRQPGVTRTFLAKSLVDENVLTVCILKLPGCASRVCLMSSQQDVLLITSSEYDQHLAEKALRQSCSIALRTAFDLYHSWVKLVEDQNIDSKTLMQQLRDFRALAEWWWGSPTLLDTLIGRSSSRDSIHYAPSFSDDMADESLDESPRE